MLNNPALLLFRSLDEDCLHFIAGTSKTNYQLSTNELDYYRVDINGHRTSQQINSLTWNAGDRVRIIKKKNYGNWYNVIGSQPTDMTYVGAQLECKFSELEPKHWLSPLPNLLPDDSFVGLIRIFNGCTTLQSVCDYLFVNMPHSNNMARLFQGCTALTTVPEHIFDGVYENMLSVAGLFQDSGITSCPSLFYEKQYPAYSSAHDIFKNSPITSVPTDFFNNLMKSGKTYTYNNCFEDTPNLESAPLKFVGGQYNPNNSAGRTQFRYVFNNSKMLQKSGIVIDLTEYSNVGINDDTDGWSIVHFWGYNNSVPNLKPCTVKVKRNSLTASTLEKKKASGDMTNTFNIQYVN
jgi:hypothetical protein